MVHLYFLSNHGVSVDHIYDPGLLDESEKLHLAAPPESRKVVMQSMFVPTREKTRGAKRLKDLVDGMVFGITL